MAQKLYWGIALTTLPLAAGPAMGQVLNPDVTVSTSLTSVAQSSSVNLLDIGAADANGLVTQQTVGFADGNGGTGAISFAGSAGIYYGTTSGVAAAPYTATGPDARNYFAAEPSGSVSIKYSQDQHYFGMMWGSVDKYNTLSFYENGTLVEQVNGANITSNPNGAQGAGNTYWVNMNFSANTAFNQVVASSSTPAFEFNTVAYSTVTQAITPTTVAQQGPTTGPTVVKVPVPAPLAGAPLVVLGRLLFRRRRARRPA